MATELDELKPLLELLGNESKPITYSKLYALSDLAGERLRAFLVTWEGLSTTRRRRLIHALVELAEANFEVNYDAIYRHSMADPDDVVRAAAVDGLWENEDQALIGPFIQLLRTDPSPQVRASAATALGRFVLAGELEQLDPPIAARILSELLNRYHAAGETTEVRRRAIESAAYACVPEVTDVLEMAYDDDDEKMHISAVFGMGRSADRRWRSIVLKEMESPYAEMRYEAARASGELGLRQAVPILARLIDDPDLQIREASIWALGQIPGPESMRVLTNAYEDADEEMATAIDEALAEHALQEGELDMPLYEMDESAEDGLADDMLVMWEADDEEDDEGDEDQDDEMIDDDWEPGEMESA
jgi:HEAT repeat protein